MLPTILDSCNKNQLQPSVSLTPLMEQHSISHIPFSLSSGRFSARLHWIQGTFKYEFLHNLDSLRERLASAFQEQFVKQKHGINRGHTYYKHVYVSVPSNMIVAYNDPPTKEVFPSAPEDDKLFQYGHGWLSIPGGGFDRSSDLWALYFNLFDITDSKVYPFTECKSRLYFYHFKCTEIHLAVDDHHKNLSPHLAYEAAKNWDFTGYRRDSVTEHSSFWLDDNGVNHIGMTVDFGTSNSDKHVTIYDKFVESRGKINSYRLEAKFSKDRAHKVFHKLRDCLFYPNADIPIDDFPLMFDKLIAQLAFGAIDFINRSQMKDGEHVDRASRLNWWEQAIADIGSLRLPAQIKKPIIEKTIEWIINQVETSLAMLEERFGFEDAFNFFLDCVQSGKTKLRDKHKAVIETSRQQIIDLLRYRDLMTT
jgi:hypothetical protein